MLTKPMGHWGRGARALSNLTRRTVRARWGPRPVRPRRPLTSGARRAPSRPQLRHAVRHTRRRGHTFATPGAYVPYGVANFREIREQGLFFKDNSAVIRQLETARVKQGFLVRPPRFGKSLLLSMVQEYYDVLGAGDVEQLFAGLAVGETRERSSFMVLPLDLSIDVDGDMESREVRQRLYNSINDSVKKFSRRYNVAVDVDPADAMSSLRRCADEVQAQGGKLLVLVDEYDRFANKLMLENPEAYRRVVAGQSGAAASSPIRSFFETLKSIERHLGSAFRSLTVGISPIALADASGANTLEDLSLEWLYGDVCGFTEADLRRCLEEMEIPNVSARDTDTAIEVMTEYYNGYRFPGSTTGLFNPTLSLYFLKKFGDNSSGLRDDVLSGMAGLRSLMDKNTMVSDSVLKLLDHTPAGLVTLLQLQQGRLWVGEVVPSLRLHRLVSVSKDVTPEVARDEAASFLYYHGAATLRHGKYRAGSSTLLVIPNNIQQQVFVAEAVRRASSVQTVVAQAFRELVLQDVANAVQEVLQDNPTPMDNTTWYESAVQVVLADRLVAVFGSDAVCCEVWAGPSKRKGSKRADIVVQLGPKRFVALELKRPQATTSRQSAKENRALAEDELLRQKFDLFVWDPEKRWKVRRPEPLQEHVDAAAGQIMAWDAKRMELGGQGLQGLRLPNLGSAESVELLVVVAAGWRVVVADARTGEQAVSSSY